MLATKLKESLRTEDTVARVGGDEFVILLPIIKYEQHIKVAAEKIIQALTKPLK